MPATEKSLAARRIGLAMLVGLLAVGCHRQAQPPAPGASTPTPGSSPKPIRIAMIAKSSTNPIFLSARRGAETAARDLSAKIGVPIEVIWLTPPQEDGQIQAQRIAQAVNEGANAILISCSDAGKLTGAIDDAVARGVAVMTFDSDAPKSKRFSYYGVDDYQLGQDVMQELAKQIGGRGKIAILAGNQNAPNLRRRVDGIKAEAAKYHGIQIVGTFYHSETPQDAAAEVIRVNNAYPDIKGWAMAGGWALFTKTLFTDLDPNKIKIVSVDALPPELPYVEKGLAPVLLAQSSYLWGNVGVTKIIDKLFYKRDVPEIVSMDPVRVTIDTLGAWARQLRLWGFPDVPEEDLKLK
ncbi:MAG TPA: substrate-binding domain-containing protein [Polyangia bacterium]|nr:substrate-binding domain-containing protein [Polyangia bacterium]